MSRLSKIWKKLKRKVSKKPVKRSTKKKFPSAKKKHPKRKVAIKKKPRKKTKKKTVKRKLKKKKPVKKKTGKKKVIKKKAREKPAKKPTKKKTKKAAKKTKRKRSKKTRKVAKKKTVKRKLKKKKVVRKKPKKKPAKKKLKKKPVKKKRFIKKVSKKAVKKKTGKKKVIKKKARKKIGKKPVKKKVRKAAKKTKRKKAKKTKKITIKPKAEIPKTSITNISKLTKKGEVILLSISDTTYAENTKEFIRKLAKRCNNICYISLSKPSSTWISWLEDKGIDKNKFTFIDAASKAPGFKEKVPHNVTHVRSLSALMELSITINNMLKRKKFDYILFDSLSTLISYNDELALIKFLHSLINKIKEFNMPTALMMLDSDSGTTVVSDVRMFVDKAVGWEEEKLEITKQKRLIAKEKSPHKQVKEQRETVAGVLERTDVKKKATDKTYIKTGIPGFDSLFEQGIPKSSSVLVAGGAGSGKTILCLQVLNNACMEGKKCLYMSFEESEAKLRQHMKDFGWDSREFEKKKLLKIKRFNPFDVARSVDALLEKARGELLIDVKPVILPSGFKPDILVVDSLTAIASAFTGRAEASYRVYIEQLFRFLEQLKTTSFLITETEQIPTKFSTTGVEEFLADGVIVLYAIQINNIRENAIEVLKLRGANHQKKIVAMRITGGRGIEVYPEQEVYSAIVDKKSQ